MSEDDEMRTVDEARAAHGYPPLPRPLPPPPPPPAPPPERDPGYPPDRPLRPMHALLACLVDEVRRIRELLLMQASSAQAQALAQQATPPGRPLSDAQLLNVVEHIATELREAAKALEYSARQLREDGKGWRASQAMAAAVRARRAADDLFGGNEGL